MRAVCWRSNAWLNLAVYRAWSSRLIHSLSEILVGLFPIRIVDNEIFWVKGVKEFRGYGAGRRNINPGLQETACYRFVPNLYSMHLYCRNSDELPAMW